MADGLRGRAGHYLLLAAAGGLVFFANLGGATLWDVDEGRNATAAVEMLASGDWVVPTFNTRLRVDKPALLYWLQMAAYSLFGINEFAARLPLGLRRVLGVVLLCYELGRSMFRPSTGLIAGLVAASTPMLCGAGRFANPDALLNFFTVLNLAWFWVGKDRPRVLWFLGLGLSAGLAVLAKGPVGLVLPGAVMAAYLVWEKEWQLLQPWGLAASSLAFAVVALPWYVWVAVDTRADFLQGFLMTHNVSRFLSTMENHHGSPLYYLLVLLAGLAPWSFLFGLTAWTAGWSAVRRPATRFQAWWARAADQDGERPRADAYRFLWAWTGCYLVFFTLAATKLPNYILPTVVPWALFTGRLLDRWRLGVITWPRWAMPVFLGSLSVFGPATTVALLVLSGAWPLADLGGRVVPGLAPWALLGLAPLVSAGGAWWCWRRQCRGAAAGWVLAGAVVFVGTLAAGVTAAFNAVKAVRPLVEASGAFRRTEDIRIGAWKMEHLPSLNFYVQRDVIHHDSRGAAVAFLRYPVPVYLFLPAQEWEHLVALAPTRSRIVARHPDLYRHGGDMVVVTNR